MTRPANWEISIVLPLGVIENQLRRIDEELRRLNMKASELAKDAENRADRRTIDARLEHIDDLLGSIAGLVYDIGADIHPEEPAASRRHGGSVDD